MLADINSDIIKKKKKKHNTQTDKKDKRASRSVSVDSRNVI